VEGGNSRKDNETGVRTVDGGMPQKQKDKKPFFFFRGTPASALSFAGMDHGHGHVFFTSD
jgi:hypothetical protein